jgi:hypothetical protein
MALHIEQYQYGAMVFGQGAERILHRILARVPCGGSFGRGRGVGRVELGSVFVSGF